MVDHKTIVDAERHEPKGISTAAVNTVYISNGAGSGAWGSPSSVIPTGLGYISGNYIMPVLGNSSAGANTIIGHIALTPFTVRTAVTVTRAGLGVATAVGASNIQQAVYANNPATFRPTGNALATVASVSGAAVVAVDGALSANLTFLPNVVYWYGVNTDTAALKYNSTSSGSCAQMNLQGVTLLASSIFFGGLDVTQAFGTWPSLTSATFTEQIAGTTYTGAVPIFKVA